MVIRKQEEHRGMGEQKGMVKIRRGYESRVEGHGS